MFCPNCGAEYKEGIEKCYDCDVLLQEEKPDLTVERWVTVLETSHLESIPIIKSALEAAGIPIATKGEGLMRLFPSHALGALMHDSAGEVQIMVPPDRAAEARELIDKGVEIDEGEEASDDEDAEA